MAGLTAIRSAVWSDPIRLALTAAANHPDSARSQYDAGRATVYMGEANGTLKQARINAREYFLRSMALDKTYAFAASSLILTYMGDGNIPPSAISELAYRLRNTRLFQFGSLLALMNAVSAGKLYISPKDFETIVTAALDNPSLTPPIRALILNDYGFYQFEILHDTQNAISLTLAAIQEDQTDPLFQLNAARLAFRLEQNEIAAMHLKNAELLDSTNLYEKEIAELKGQIKGN